MKVNLGNSGQKKSFFPVKFDSSGTTNFGEVLPTFCQEVAQDSSVNIDIRSGVRFSPLSKPTFGQAYYRHYLYYIKYADLYHPFENLLSKTPYGLASGSSYVPTEVPTIPLGLLWRFVFLNSDVTAYKATFTAPVTNGDLVERSLSNIVALDVNQIGSPSNAVTAVSTFINTYYPIPASAPDNAQRLQTIFRSSLRYGYPSSNLDMFEVGSYATQVTLDAADHIMFMPANSDGTNWVNSSGTFNIVAFRLNDIGKFFRKILLGLGYKLLPSSNQLDKVSLLPLFGFYKAYFELFAPKRFINWTDTYCCKYIHQIVDNGYNYESAMVLPTPLNNNFTNFMYEELLNCYYTEDSNYVSAHITGTAVGPAQSFSYLNANGVSESVGNTENNQPYSALVASYATLDQTKLNVLKKLTQYVNRKTATGGAIGAFLRSVFGYNPEYLEQSAFFGSESLDIQFSDVMNLSSSDGAELGEYAGRASGFSTSGNFNCRCNAHGCIICLSTVIPRTQFVNGINPNLFHYSQHSFYNGMFDGLTLVPTKKISIFAPESVNPLHAYGKELSGNFGNIPIYSEYKTTTQGILNGDLSLRSTRASFDGFTLDRFMSDSSSLYRVNEDGTYDFRIRGVNPNNIVNGTQWRYIGRLLWMGRFDRIFTNTKSNSEGVDPTDRFNANIQSEDDNIIVHNVVDVKINAPMLPIADSFQTHDEDDNYGVSIDKQ